MLKGEILALDFDMDGVLIDSENLAVRSEREVCARYGIVVPKTAWPAFKGMRSREMFEWILANCTKGSFDLDALVEERRARYLELAETELEMFDGAIAMLSAARVKFGKRIALTTSSSPPSQQQAFRKFKLDQYFGVVVTAAHVRQGKPHPEAYLKTVKLLGVPAAQVAVVEDSENGVVAACTAGCQVVGITHSVSADKLWAADAHEVVDRLSELHCLFRL